jgi:hypothetical protein
VKTKQSAAYKEPVRTAQYTFFTTVVKTNQLVVYKAMVAVCFETGVKHPMQSEHREEF